MGTDCFDFPKDELVLQELVGMMTGEGDIVMDFFAGSGTTGHSVMLQNREDGKRRRFILVQLPEPLDPDRAEQAVAAAFCDKLRKPRNIATLTKERLRRAGRAVADGRLGAIDVGYRTFRLDYSCLRPWNSAKMVTSDRLEASIEHIEPGRTSSDLLNELLLKRGLDLCVPIETKTIAGKMVHSVGAGSLIACLDTIITRADGEPLALDIVQWHKDLNPAGETAVVFRDDAFADDVVKTNVAAILEQHGLKNVRSL
jgi:adenine-specific DNA-methyltransferase